MTDARDESQAADARKAAELDAVIRAVTTNGYGRLMEMIPAEDHPEALACIKGMVCAAVAALHDDRGSMSTDGEGTNNGR